MCERERERVLGLLIFVCLFVLVSEAPVLKFAKLCTRRSLGQQGRGCGRVQGEGGAGRAEGGRWLGWGGGERCGWGGRGLEMEVVYLSQAFSIAA